MDNLGIKEHQNDPDLDITSSNPVDSAIINIKIILALSWLTKTCHLSLGLNLKS